MNYIINKLYSEGYEAYAVGGCVRDSYLGKIPKDWDITTSASPDEVKKLFKKTVDTGIQHGTVTVIIEHEGYEVTTFRIDGEYEDNRHPKQVVFTSNLVEDLKRRDFTINAMAYNDIVGLVDCFDGKGDLEKKIIRCVGNADERFNEDALRILRALRFSAQLDFSINEETIEAIRKKASNLTYVSAERIKIELDKIISSNNPDRLIKAYEYGVTKIVLPEFDIMMNTQQENPNHIYNVGMHTIKALNNINLILNNNYEADDNVISLNNFSKMDISDKNKLMLRWTILLHDVAKPDAKYFDDNGIAHFKMHEVLGVDKSKAIFKRLKFDRYTQDIALRLIKYHDYRFTNNIASLRRAINKIGMDIMDYLFIVKIADIKAQNPNTINDKLLDLEQTANLYQEIKIKKQCVAIKDLEINGNDLIQLGIKNGPQIGKCLNFLLECVMDDPSNNDREKLIDIIRIIMIND